MAKLYDDVKVIDADTHFTEPPDLWTSRAPAAYQDRILHIEERNGVPTWVVDGAELGFAKGGGVVDHDGGKIPFLESMDKGIDWVHPGAWDPKARLQVMDECGIHAQVLFPNAVGLGGTCSTPSSRTRRCGCCASRSTTTPWPRCRTSRTSGSSRCPSCPRGTSTCA